MGTAALVISDEDRATLVSWARSRAIRASHVERAQIVLAVADGKGTSGTAREVGVSRPTVIKWRDRFAQLGLAGLEDEPRPGRPKVVDDSAIIAATLEPPPESLAVTHWSSRLLGRHLGIGDATVARAWRKYRVQPWRRETFKFSTDPELEAKVRDVVGLYLNPPTNAIVLCVDEKSQIQALDRTQPILPMQPGLIERRSHDYVRHGTTSLFAALNVADGTVISSTHRRHRATEFKKFLTKIEAHVPAHLDVHVICDNYGTHKHPNIKKWLQSHPRFTMHFTPTYSSWINQVERLFAEITRELLQRSDHRSVQALEKDLRSWVRSWNENPKPFIWTKTAEEILASLGRLLQRTTGAGH